MASATANPPQSTPLGTRAASTGIARVGHVRLGHLVGSDRDHDGRFPDLLCQRGRCGGYRPPRLLSRLAWANTVAAVLIALLAPLLGAVADFKAAEETIPGRVHAARRRVDGSDVLCHAWPVAARVDSVRAVAGRCSGKHDVLRVALAAYCQRQGDGPYFDGGVCVGIYRGRVVARSQPGMDFEPRNVWLAVGRRAHAIGGYTAGAPSRSFLSEFGGWCFRCRCSSACRNRRERLNRMKRRAPILSRWAFTRLGETLREIRSYKQAFLAMLAFTIYNDGYSDDHQDGDGFWNRDWNCSERSDNGDSAGAVCRHSVRVCVWRAGGKGGSEGVDTVRTRGVHGYLHLRLRDIVSARVLRSRHHGWFGARRHPGAQPITFCQHGSEAQERGSFLASTRCSKSLAEFSDRSFFAIAIGQSGSSRVAILWVIAFFVVGGVLLVFVDTKEGERVARSRSRGRRASARSVNHNGIVGWGIDRPAQIPVPGITSLLRTRVAQWLELEAREWHAQRESVRQQTSAVGTDHVNHWPPFPTRGGEARETAVHGVNHPGNPSTEFTCSCSARCVADTKLTSRLDWVIDDGWKRR